MTSQYKCLKFNKRYFEFNSLTFENYNVKLTLF